MIIASSLLRESQEKRTVTAVATDTSIGARVRTLREAVGIKSQDLAAIVGIDPSAMSNIERGKRSVKTNELARIAAALSVSPLALLDDDSLPARMPVAPRTAGGLIGTGTAYPRLVALSELHQILEDAGISNESGLDGVPKVDAARWKAAAEHLATWAMTALGNVGAGDARFMTVADSIEDRLGVDVLVEGHQGDALAGAAISDPAFPLIFVNADQPIPRALFTLAHELGHLLAGHGEPIALDEDLSGRNEVERLANAFAATFLMPEHKIRATIERRGRGVEALAWMTYEFGVSFESLIYRLHNLQIVNAEGRDALRRVGWHGLLNMIERGDAADSLGPEVRRSLVGRLGSQPERRAPRRLVERALQGYRKGALSIRPLAGLLDEDPDLLLGQVERLDPAAADILRPEVSTAPADGASDDDLYGGSPV